MKRSLALSAASFIVVAGMNASNALANLTLDQSPITQHTCESRFDLTADGLIERAVPVDSERFTEPGEAELNTDNWPSGLLILLQELNEKDFEEGILTIVDCVGTSKTIQARSRDFDLNYLDRQGNEERGWRFNAHAYRDEEGVLRILRLELPANHEWKINATGDGLIATQALFHQLNFRINEVPSEDGPIAQFGQNTVGVDSSAPDSVFPDQLRQDGVRYERIRVTEVKLIGNSLQFEQLTTTNKTFDERRIWTIN